MATIASQIRAELDKAKADVVRDFPELISALGVDTSDKDQVVHALLTYLIKVVEAVAQSDLQAAEGSVIKGII